LYATIHASPTDANRLYATGYFGLERSADGGTTWRPVRDDLLRYTSGFAIQPDHAAKLLIGTLVGVVRTADGGATWALSDKGIAERVILSVAVAPTDPMRVYAVGYIRSADQAVFYRSDDGGASWPDPVRLPSGYTTGIATDPANEDVVYAGRARSSDGGLTWAKMPIPHPGRVTSIVDDPLDPSILFAAMTGHLRPGVFTSSDGGATWTHTGLFGRILSLAIDPAHPSVLYAGTHDLGRLAGHLEKSRDGGATWHSLATPSRTTQVLSVAVNPVHTSTVYAGTIAHGVLKTTNGGRSWTTLTAGPAGVDSLAIDHFAPATIYAASGSAVFVTRDGGAAWSPFGQSGGSSYTSPAYLSLDPIGSTLYSASQNGVWSTPA
jgi:photosystem II stability/assembly factor-like uncharacterized protein